MNIVKRIKKVIYSISIAIAMLPMKISSAKQSINNIIEPVYGAPQEPPRVKGIGERIAEVMSNIIMFAGIPIVLLVGAIIFYRKSKFKNLIKATVLLLVGIAIGFYLGYAIYNY